MDSRDAALTARLHWLDNREVGEGGNLFVRTVQNNIMIQESWTTKI